MEKRSSILCRQLLCLQKVGMAMQQCVALHQWRKLRLIEKMPMGRKNRMPVQCEDRIIRHHRELQHHLIDLRLTVATYRPDSVLQRIQHRDDLLRCILLRKVVTWSVIEDVSEKDQALCAALLELLQGPAAPVCRAVDITCNEIFHILYSPVFLDYIRSGAPNPSVWMQVLSTRKVSIRRAMQLSFSFSGRFRNFTSW